MLLLPACSRCVFLMYSHYISAFAGLMLLCHAVKLGLLHGECALLDVHLGVKAAVAHLFEQLLAFLLT